MVNKPCEYLAATSGSLYSCEPFNGYTRIRTPFLYPDGDVIDLFLRDEGTHQRLTDLGETVRWLNVQTPVAKRTTKQTKLLYDTCVTHGIEFFSGALTVRVNELTFTDDLSRLAQACMRVSDLWFTFRTRAIETVTEEVAEFLNERHVPFEANETHLGRSTRKWKVDFHTQTPTQSCFVQVLSTGTRGAARRITEHVLGQWYDLHHLASATGIRFVSLFDDTLDIWAEDDFNILADLSEVQFWSRPDDFALAIGT
jgi:hypothetical protein